MKPISNEIIEKIVELYDSGKSTREIRTITEVSLHSIEKYIKTNGRQLGKSRILKTEQEEQDAVEMYERGDSFVDIAKKYKCSVSGLIAALEKLGIESRGQFKLNEQNYNQKYFSNESYFEKIDSPEKAYWLGFFYADGYNDESGGRITLSQSSPREGILYKFKASIEATNPVILNSPGGEEIICGKVCNVQDSYRISISSKQLSQDLARLGCVQKKTQVITYPSSDIVPKEFESHFIRGYFDGDGSVSNSSDTNLQFNIIGTKEFLLDLQKVLIDIGFNETKISPARNGSDIHMLIYGGTMSVERFYNYIYKDAILFVEDKKNKFEEGIKSKDLRQQQTKGHKDLINQKIKDLHNSGYSFREIAKKLNVSRTGMSSIVNQI